MPNTSGKYTRYFKEKALEEWARGKRPTWVAREFGIDRTTLYRWFHQWQGTSAPKMLRTRNERLASHHEALYSQFSADGTITMPKTPAPTPNNPRRSQVDKSPSAVRISFVWLLPLAEC